ncbi:amino acid decarboxylase [Lentzea sp. NBRC 105346]|uniref:pyridoxal phosphate-dependent decarboxylase family protein n=1 Tax=Lentzea sp. NBRC 105346 TaxID=3032205 RepID=UPI0024A34263|nr:aminotransferase class V-fold PLP-dependent enzyme [Lentzea sp. NBRC 105346]GLZ36107.1 amino acid decarboxylase [Lentzea sp. NBRC 105346]
MHPRSLPPGRPTQVLAAAFSRLGDALPEEGIGPDEALQRIDGLLTDYGVNLRDAFCAAHLQPPPLAVAVKADALASASNASLDTYDSGPATIAVERWVVTKLAELAGYADGDGVFTPGGTMSNLTALMLARDAAAARRGVNARLSGVHALPEPTVYCSELAHFSVQRACAALGLGENAVRPIEVDDDRRMRTDSLQRALNHAVTPVAVVATAGTTDFGSIDPLPAIADIAERHGAWLHVDAAYGFGALFSDRLSGLLDGLVRADSVTADLHKIGWQPASASVLLVRTAEAFSSLDRSVAYLNPEDDRIAGYDGLLGRTLQTTRRPDAVKVAASLLAYGRQGLGGLVDHCHALARHAAELIAGDPVFELIGEVVLTTVVFRYVATDPELVDEVNAELRRHLMRTGVALVGRTDVGKATCLKFTLLNPTTTFDDLVRLLGLVRHAGAVSEDMLRQEGLA